MGYGNPSVMVTFPSGKTKEVYLLRLLVQAQNAEFKAKHGMFLPTLAKLHPTVKALREEVTNLGWLLRNYEAIIDLCVSTQPPTVPSGHTGRACLAARLKGGLVYATHYDDRTLLHQWLMRPVLRGRPVYWNHTLYCIGSNDYNTELKERVAYGTSQG